VIFGFLYHGSGQLLGLSMHARMAGGQKKGERGGMQAKAGAERGEACKQKQVQSKGVIWGMVEVLGGLFWLYGLN
jgi:hypothetical protein